GDHRRDRRQLAPLFAQPAQYRGDVGASRQSGGAGALSERAPDQGGGGQARGDSQVSETKKTTEPKKQERRFAIDRLMTVVMAPVVSEKSTFVADKHRQYVFRV